MSDKIVTDAENTVAMASVKHTAEMVVAYYSTLVGGGLPEDFSRALTYRWHDATLFGAELVLADDDDDDEDDD